MESFSIRAGFFKEDDIRQQIEQALPDMLVILVGF
jgi:hypothetical protein